MFSTNHFIWLGISAAVMAAAFRYLKKHRPPLSSVLSVACVIAAASELIKVFSIMVMVPSTDGTAMHLYLELEQLPFHLCSLQILFIFLARFTQNEKLRETLLAFMYPTCSVGALFAMAIPTCFTENIDVSQAFTHPLAYQYFLYHATLIVLGVYIAMSGEISFKPRHYLSTLGLLAGLAFISLYLNSLFAVPNYVNGELVSIDYVTNFFFTHHPPIDIPLTQKWHWFVYIGVIFTLAVVLIGALYLPWLLKARKTRKTGV